MGGAYEEYVAYFGREDLPDDMWSFTRGEGVKAVAGFSVVPKKNEVDQRKLLMQCSTNYAWSLGKDRSDFGLLGGTALASCHAPKDVWAIAVCDESLAATSIRTPPWMWAWSCCPPMRRQDAPLAISPLSSGVFPTWLGFTRATIGWQWEAHMPCTSSSPSISRPLVVH